MIPQLYNLIGQKVRHEQRDCILIEVLEDGPHLVFQCPGEKKIQCNQYGNAHRRTHTTYTIHCLNEMKTDLHPVLKSLLTEEHQHELLEKLLTP